MKYLRQKSLKNSDDYHQPTNSCFLTFSPLKSERNNDSQKKLGISYFRVIQFNRTATVFPTENRERERERER